MSSLKNLYKRLSRTGNIEVEVSEKGVLHVDAERLLKTDAAKQQVRAARRLERVRALRRRLVRR